MPILSVRRSPRPRSTAMRINAPTPSSPIDWHGSRAYISHASPYGSRKQAAPQGLRRGTHRLREREVDDLLGVAIGDEGAGDGSLLPQDDRFPLDSVDVEVDAGVSAHLTAGIRSGVAKIHGTEHDTIRVGSIGEQGDAMTIDDLYAATDEVVAHHGEVEDTRVEAESGLGKERVQPFGVVRHEIERASAGAIVSERIHEGCDHILTLRLGPDEQRDPC